MTEKATGAKIGEIGIASAEDVSAAAATARRGQKDWAKVPGPKHGDVLREFSRLLLAHSEEITNQIVRETGSIRAKAQWEVQITAREFMEAADSGRHHWHYHALELAVHSGCAGDRPRPRNGQRRDPEARLTLAMSYSRTTYRCTS